MAKRRFEMIQDVVPNWVTNGQADWSGARPVNPAFTVPACDEEWRFEYGRRSLVGIKKRGLLVPNAAYLNTLLQPPGPVGLDIFPSYTANSLTTAARSHAGLISPYAQATEETFYLLWQFPVMTTTANYRFLGNLTTVAADGGYDLSIQYTSTSSVYQGPTVTTRGVAPNRSVVIPAAGMGAQALFIGLTHSAGGRGLYIGGVSYIFDAGSPVLAPASRPHALGEVYYLGGANGGFTYFAFGHAPRAFTQADFDVAYALVKQSAAARGVTVY